MGQCQYPAYLEVDSLTGPQFEVVSVVLRVYYMIKYIKNQLFSATIPLFPYLKQ